MSDYLKLILGHLYFKGHVVYTCTVDLNLYNRAYLTADHAWETFMVIFNFNTITSGAIGESTHPNADCTQTNCDEQMCKIL